MAWEMGFLKLPRRFYCAAKDEYYNCRYMHTISRNQLFVNISSLKLFISCSNHFHAGILVIHTSVLFHFNYIAFSLFWGVKFWRGRLDKVAANNEETEKIKFSAQFRVAINTSTQFIHIPYSKPLHSYLWWNKQKAMMLQKFAPGYIYFHNIFQSLSTYQKCWGKLRVV